jgi:enterochelin esterase-like enzyme
MRAQAARTLADVMAIARKSSWLLGPTAAILAVAVVGLWRTQPAHAAHRYDAGVAGFSVMQKGAGGGTVWTGVVPDPARPLWHRRTLVYVPPRFNPDLHYPVIYLLSGLPGSPYSFTSALRLADVADGLITHGAVKPFVAVMPPAGRNGQYHGEWAGQWERYLVQSVVPWARRTLRVQSGTGAAIAGLSAGGYGALDIGLRHVGMFGTLESWSGYFKAFKDGPLKYASRADLRAHSPAVLVVQDQGALQRLGTQFYLSTGTSHGKIQAAWTLRYARRLAELGLPVRLYRGVDRHNGRWWLSQLPTALEYAFPGADLSTTPAA